MSAQDRDARDGEGRPGGGMNKIVADRPFADPDAAARKLVEIASDLRGSVRSLNLTFPMVLHIAAEKIVEGRPNSSNRS
jgi:hypothetical protein